MGTYTTNKNLFMPTVGETGWGTLVNNNFSTIDTFLKPITVSGSTYTFTGNHVGNQSGGSVSATTGTFSGAVKGASFNGVILKSSGTITVTPKNTTKGYILGVGNGYTMLLPPLPNVTYSGSIKFLGGKTGTLLYYDDGSSNADGNKSVTIGNTVYTFTFNNIDYFACGWYNGGAQYYDFTLS